MAIQDTRRFPRFQDDEDLVWFCFSKVGLDEGVAPSLGRFQNGDTPTFRAVLDPVLKLPSDVAQNVSTDWV